MADLKPFDGALDAPTSLQPFDGQLDGEAPKPAGMIRRIGKGISNTFEAGRIAATNDTDAIAGIISESERTREPATPVQQQMAADIAPYAKRANEAKGVVDNVIGYGALAGKRISQFASNPGEFTGMVAENLPNSLPGLAAGLAGAAGGTALAGPVGGVVGGIAGGTAGGYAVEQGSSMKDQILKEASARGINPTDQAALAAMVKEKYPAFLEASRLKGVGTAATDAALNVATFGLAGMGERVIAKEARALADMASTGKIGAEQAAKSLAELEAKQAARNTLGAKSIRGAGVVGAEMFGEGFSEGVGQKLAYGSVDAGDVVDESLLGLGTGLGMAAGRKTISRLAGVTEKDAVESALQNARDAVAKNTPQPEQAPPGPAPLQIGNTPDPMVGFADGTVGRRSEVEKYISGLPAEQQPAARAKLMGLAPQPAKPSEAMGLTPTPAPSLTNAAILAVDSGVSQPAMPAADPVQAAMDEYRIQTAATLQQTDELAYNAYMTAIEQASVAQDEVPGETITAVVPIANVLSEYDHLSDDEFFAQLGATPEEIQDAATDQPSSPQASDASPVSSAANVATGTGESAPAVDAKQANLERIRAASRPQPTTLGTQTNAVAGPGFGVNDVVPKQPQTQAEQAPVATDDVAKKPESALDFEVKQLKAQVERMQRIGAPFDAEKFASDELKASGRLSEVTQPTSTPAASTQSAPMGATPEPKFSLDTLDWNPAKLGDYSMEQLNQLYSEVKAQFSNATVNGSPVDDRGMATKEPLNARGQQIHAALQKAMDAAYKKSKAAPTTGTSATASDIKAITAKQIPDMSDDELQQAITHYGPKHARTAKLNKEVNRRALVAKLKPVSQPTESTSAQTNQAQPQQTQQQAAPAAVDTSPETYKGHTIYMPVDGGFMARSMDGKNFGDFVSGPHKTRELARAAVDAQQSGRPAQEAKKPVTPQLPPAAPVAIVPVKAPELKAATPAQATLNKLWDLNSSTSLNDLDAATHEVDIGFLKELHTQLRDLDTGASIVSKKRKQDRIGYLLAAIQAKETGKGGIGPKPAARKFSDGQQVYISDGLYSGNAGTIESIKPSGSYVVKSDNAIGSRFTVKESEITAGQKPPEAAPEKPRALNGADTKKSEALFQKPARAPEAPKPPVSKTETTAAPSPKPDTLSDKEKAAKAKMFNALGKLAALAGKNTRMNWTPEEEQQLLPIVIELFDGAMELGSVTFQKAVRYVREFIANNLDQATADAIPFETLQGAYIHTARKYKDQGATTGKEVMGFDSLEELDKSAEKADIETTPTPVTDEPKESLLGANDDTRRNATDDSEPLDETLQGGRTGDGAGGNAETGIGLRPSDAQGNGRPEGSGSGRGNSLDGSQKPVLPSTPAEIRPLADGPVGKTEDRPQQLSGENPGNFVITDEFKLGQGTDGDKISGNLAAIRTLRLVQKENRYPTKDEQAIMARYVGWGGLKTVFDPKKATATDQFGKAQRELKTLLSADEYRAANGSIRNAHYTAEGVVDGMWRVIRFMGFKGGRSLEPTVGIGNFIGRMPADMAASTEWHASELDTTTGQLAAMLYPEANILASTGFQDAPFADGAFDISVGNPPFGSQTITDKSPNRKHLNGQKIHNYIIAKAGMHLRPGGVMSMVVTHRFLDTANPEARDVLAKDFRFLGAFRLPNDAFKKNAGTDVVTDVVFLQKLGADEKRERDASWLDVNGSIDMDGQAIRVNRYYQDHPAHILGRSALDGSMQRTGEAEYTVHSDGRDIGKAIDALMQDGFSHMAGVLEKSNNVKALAPAMLTQSSLPIGGVMVNDEGKIVRRELNDDLGNAVIQEITADTLWKDQAAEWQALRGAVLDIKQAAQTGKVTADDANEVLALSRFLFKSDGTQQAKPNKAVEAVYRLVEDLAKPATFQWSHNEALLLITGALNRKQLGEDGYQALKGMLDLRNRTLRLIMAEQSNSSEMEAYRADLNKAYDAFVKVHGFLSDSKNANLLEGDVGAEAGIESSFVPAISAAVAKSSGTPQRVASATKSDIMTQRVNFPYKEISHADSPADALFASISEHGKVDLPYMAKITNQSVQSVIEALTKGDNPQLFRDPETGEYQEAERYLSGNVKHKLQLAMEHGLEANIKALEKSLPADKSKDQVKPNIRGIWMPPEIFTEFLTAIGYSDAKLTVIPSQGILQANGDRMAMTDFGIQFKHGKRTPMDMFNSQASGKPIIISVTSNGKTYKDEQGTKEVNALAERMGKVFQEWAYADDNRVKRIVAAFNQNMNTHTPRTFDGVKYLKPVGASPSIVMRRTQMDGAWRMMQERTMLADHVVGAGKTYTLITGIMERRRMGLSRKPMVVVPNHLVTQWARDFYKLYPGAKVLAASPADFAKKNRRRLLARIATGDYDAVIVGHTSIGFMETPAEDLKAIVDEKLAGLKEALAEARKNNESKRTLGQIEDRIDRYEDRLKELAARPTDDIGIDFKALGIDHLSVDEAHEFKNLEYSTSGERVVGMNDPNGSKKAFDLYSKVRGLLSRGGGVTFATGTPVSNSLVEIYTMMSYLAHDELVLRGQEHFDSWSGAYAATETRLEYTATQKLKPRRVLAGLNNLSALRQLYEQFADIITMADLKRIYSEEMAQKNKKNGTDFRTDFPVPKVMGGKRQLVSGDITPAQKEYMDYLVARMMQIEANKGDKEYKRIDNPLNVLTDARKMSLDIRIVDPTAQRDENGKVATAAKNIKATYDKWEADRGTQLVFCDLSTPAKTAAKDARRIISETVEKLFGKDLAKQAKKQLDGMSFEKQWAYLEEKAEQIAEDPATSEEKRDAIAEYMGKVEDPQATMNVADIGFSVYDDLKTVLMESGIPESEIAFIHDYNTPEQKEKLFDRVNNGYVRVLLGSSMKMGAGMNVQERLVALHHMDAPWRPSDVEQREGRIIRQKNKLYERDPDGFEVDIKAYSTNQTSDTVMWQILERKAGAIEQFREGGLDAVEEEGGDSNQYAEFMATSTGNPVFRQKLEAERKLTDIESEIGGALIVRSNATSFLESFDRRRKSAQSRMDAAKAFDASSAAYGGESGTQAEFEAAMKVANDEYLTKYAIWTQKKADADLAVAKWEVELEMVRGDKPTMPTMPSQPDLYTKSVQKASGYARAIGMALDEATVGKTVKITMGNGSVVVDGQEYAGSPYWTAIASINGEKFILDSSGAQKASASSRIIRAVTPFAIANKMEGEAKSSGYDVAELNRDKVLADKNAKIAVSTEARDTAREELNWLTAQVAFAEVEADIARGASKNRYIERDKRRNISQTAAVAMEAPKRHVIDGIGYTTTGLKATANWQRVEQATRDTDGVPSMVIVGGLEKGTISAVIQPESLRKTKPAKAKTLLPLKPERMDPVNALFSQGLLSPASFGPKPTPDQIQRLVDKVLQVAKNIVPVSVIGNPSQIAGIRVPAGSKPKGALVNGRIYLFSDNIESIGDAYVTLFHELFHLGLQKVIPAEDYAAMLRKFSRNVLVQKYVREWKASPEGMEKATTMPSAAYEALAAEEAMAMISEELSANGGIGTRKLPGLVKTMLSWFAGVAERLGFPAQFGTWIRKLSQNDAEKFVTDMVRAVMGGDKILGKTQAKYGTQAAEMTAQTRLSAGNPDIRFSQGLGDTLASAANNVREVKLPAGYLVGDLINGAPGKLGWWHRTVGTQYHLAQKSQAFKRVFDGVQTFLNDVSFYATEAADMAPNILPKLETWKDIGKSPVSAADTKAFSAPVFEGTLNWGRDESGKAVRMETLEAAAKKLTTEQKAQRLLRGNHISEGVLKMWQGLPIDQFEAIIEGKFERDMLKAGAVFTDAELKQHFKLTAEQIKLYREFRQSTDKSLTNLAIADMLRFGGDDVFPIRDVVLESKNVTDAANTLSKYLLTLTDIFPERTEVLTDTANKMIDKGNKAKDLMDRGYAPLSRFGQYTLDVVDTNGERVYFGMFESKWEAARMNRNMQTEYPGAQITQGTVSEEAYKLFAGVSPETLALFGDMLGLEAQGDGKTNEAFQEYLKLAKSNRSAMKRLIQRKGIAGFNEDAGRVLAGFVYSNARQTASSLHMGEMTNAVNDMPKQQGELKDAAVKLVDYIKNPQEEAQAFRGLLFTQYIGGSVASAMVNMTQPLTMTFPWLSQFGGVAGAGKQMTAAMKDALKKQTGDKTLDAALKRAEEDGTVSPQEVHQLMQQAQGRGALRSGDGTTAGDLAAKGSNALSRFSLGWGKLFSTAEQFNRRVTFIAAYRTAVAQKITDPDAFARRAISETQGIYNKGNKPQWARGAVGGVLFTFKQYSVAYIEMLQRMSKNGPEGKKAALLALGVLFLMSGAGGLPGADDLDDIISGAMQSMGYNYDSKQKRQEFFVSLLGEDGARFMERGVSGLPGVPIDVAGRMGLGNLIPGTGLFQKKPDHTRDVAELFGPGGDLVKRGYDAAGKVLKGEVLGARGAIMTAAPKAMQNLAQAYDMANMGMYRDMTGKKVIDSDASDALVKAIGFQPNDVARVQDASFDVQRMIGINKMRESEIADKWAKGLFEKDSAKVQEARLELAQWNTDNSESPIRINFKQIMQRVNNMKLDKSQRLAKTAPKEIRAAVKQELSIQ